MIRFVKIAVVFGILSIGTAVSAANEQCLKNAGTIAYEQDGYAPGTDAWREDALTYASQYCNLSSAGSGDEQAADAYLKSICSSPDKCYIDYASSY